jgi:toxin ParE1/3/4
VKVRYTSRAAHQLEAILDYIADRSPQGAESVMDRIEATLHVLVEHPLSGQATNRPGYRRAVVGAYPYVIVYQPKATEIVIHGVRHTARRRIG